jgi:hypothetical protein
MTYELWDTETGNLVEAFDSEAEALVATRELIVLNADVYPQMLTLLSVDPRGQLVTVATGDNLGAMASSVAAREARRSG